jgi:hypothetical protein
MNEPRFVSRRYLVTVAVAGAALIAVARPDAARAQEVRPVREAPPLTEPSRAVPSLA